MTCCVRPLRPHRNQRFHVDRRGKVVVAIACEVGFTSRPNYRTDTNLAVLNDHDFCTPLLFQLEFSPAEWRTAGKSVSTEIMRLRMSLNIATL